jgi:hypothetical protein
MSIDTVIEGKYRLKAGDVRKLIGVFESRGYRCPFVTQAHRMCMGDGPGDHRREVILALFQGVGYYGGQMYAVHLIGTSSLRQQEGDLGALIRDLGYDYPGYNDE